MNRKQLLSRAKQWKKVLELLQKDDVTVDDICAQHPWLLEEETLDSGAPASAIEPRKAAADSPLPREVLSMLEKESGLGSEEAWWNIWWLVSKSEHNNEKREAAFDSDKKGVSVFEFCSALPYDWKDRGVTMGLVGFTVAYDGKDAKGDAMDLFKVYTSLGGCGDELAKLAVGCTKDRKRCEALMKKLREIGKDPKWIEAQWRALFLADGYLRKTMDTWKKVGVAKPSALAIATVLDCSLNQGWDGKDGGCTTLEKCAVKGDENKTLQKYNAWRRTVAGTNDYNSPPINGKNRADQFEKLRQAGVFSLQGPEATKAIQDAIRWTMK